MAGHDVELQMAEPHVPGENGEPVREKKIGDRQLGPKAQLLTVQCAVTPCAVPQSAWVGSHAWQLTFG